MSHHVDTSALMWRSLASDADKVLWSDTGKDYTIEELKSELQASSGFIQSLLDQLLAKNETIADQRRSINELTSSLRQGIKR